MIVPVVLSGGSGSRLWPLSRELYPKQFLPLVSELSLLQATLHRLQPLQGCAAPLIVCNEEHRFLVAEQLRQLKISPQAIVLEPAGRNTAPAVALAALTAVDADPDAVLLVLPADHAITKVDAFIAGIGAGLAEAQAGKLVTFGIVPTAPETGYGYIKAGPGDAVRPVAEFVEKPELAVAERYLRSGEYFWNSGMFLFRADAYLAELRQHAPAMAEACGAAYAAGQRDADFLRPDAARFAACPSDSIDYALMERTRRAVVVPIDAGWSDVGSWRSLHEVSAQDAAGNVAIGDVLIENSRNSYIYSEGRLVAAVGVQDHVIVETADAVLVAHRDHAQDVKKIVERLKREGRAESVAHRRVHRPWGCYESIASAERFQVKRITVNPGASLSLQMHHHRAEHWTVVKGTAKVHRGGEVMLLSEDQSTYIPLGMTHRLENPGKIPLELIEVQTGAYLGEDDIVRFDDHYGRGAEPASEAAAAPAEA